MLRDVVAGMVEEVQVTAAEAASLAKVQLPTAPAEIPIVNFREALKLVGADPDEPDLSPEHERKLGRWAWDRYESELLAVEGYPARSVRFIPIRSAVTLDGPTPLI
jgi:nondiscriminating aspartyl-tRNA synthetase